VQILPYLAKEAAHLTLYQRNAPWIMPKMISNISERVKYIFRTFPAVMRLYRIILFLVVRIYIYIIMKIDLLSSHASLKHCTLQWDIPIVGLLNSLKDE
jgi:cation diffusion facilitator CzcD-associated flavoprotein CzcO